MDAVGKFFCQPSTLGLSGQIGYIEGVVLGGGGALPTAFNSWDVYSSWEHLVVFWNGIIQEDTHDKPERIYKDFIQLLDESPTAYKGFGQLQGSQPTI